MFALKGYQQRAMDTLADFLSKAKQTGDVGQAYSDTLKEQQLPLYLTVTSNFAQCLMCASVFPQEVVKQF